MCVVTKNAEETQRACSSSEKRGRKKITKNMKKVIYNGCRKPLLNNRRLKPTTTGKQFKYLYFKYKVIM